MKPILHKRKIEYELEGFGCTPQQSLTSNLHLYVNSSCNQDSIKQEAAEHSVQKEGHQLGMHVLKSLE